MRVRKISLQRSERSLATHSRSARSFQNPQGYGLNPRAPETEIVWTAFQDPPEAAMTRRGQGVDTVTCGNRDIKLVNAAPLAGLDFMQDLVAGPDDDSGPKLLRIYLSPKCWEVGMVDIVPFDLARAQPRIARVVTHCAAMHG